MMRPHKTSISSVEAWIQRQLAGKAAFSSPSTESLDTLRETVYHHLWNGVQACPMYPSSTTGIRSYNCYFIYQNHLVLAFFSFRKQYVLDLS